MPPNLLLTRKEQKMNEKQYIFVQKYTHNKKSKVYIFYFLNNLKLFCFKLIFKNIFYVTLFCINFYIFSQKIKN